MLFLDALSGAIQKGRREGNYYFRDGSLPDWALDWLGYFPSRLWASNGQQFSLGQIADVLDSTTLNAPNAEFKASKNRLKMAFLLEMAAMKAHVLPSAGREGPKELKGLLHFLLSTNGENRPGSWPNYHPPTNTQRSKTAQCFIRKELAECYLRLLSACLWHHCGPNNNFLPISLPKLGLSDVDQHRFEAIYRERRNLLYFALVGMRHPGCVTPSKFWIGFHFGKESLPISFRPECSDIERIFYCDKEVDQVWLDSYVASIRDRHPVPTGDRSAVYFNYSGETQRILNFNDCGKYNISLMLVIILEELFMTCNRDPFLEGVASLEAAWPRTALAGNLVREFVSDEEQAVHQRHLERLHQPKTGKQASRFTPPGGVIPSPTSWLKAITRASDLPGNASMEDGTPGTEAFYIWQGSRGSHEYIQVLDRDQFILVQEEGAWDHALSAWHTLAIRLPHKIWKKAPFGAQSFVHWVSLEEGHPWYYIPHRQFPTPFSDGAVIYLELDRDFLTATEGNFLLSDGTDVSVGVHMAHGLIHLFVMLT